MQLMMWLWVSANGTALKKGEMSVRQIPAPKHKEFDLPSEMVIGCFCWRYEHGQSNPISSSSGLAEPILQKC